MKKNHQPKIQATKIRVVIDAYYAEDRVEAHVLLSSIKVGEAVLYQDRFIQKLENGYRADIAIGKLGRKWAPVCKSATKTLLKVETEHSYTDARLALELNQLDAQKKKARRLANADRNVSASAQSKLSTVATPPAS